MSCLKFYIPIRWEIHKLDSVCFSEDIGLDCAMQEFDNLEKTQKENERFSICKLSYKVRDFKLLHSFMFKIKEEKDEKGWYQLLDNDFSVDTFLTIPLDNQKMEEEIKNKINNGRYYMTKEWKSILYDDYLEEFCEDTEKVFIKRKPYSLAFNHVMYQDKNNIWCDDAGIIINYEKYEVRISAHSEFHYDYPLFDKKLFGDRCKDLCKKEPRWYKFYFITMTNKKTKEAKKYTYWEEEGAKPYEETKNIG